MGTVGSKHVINVHSCPLGVVSSRHLLSRFVGTRIDQTHSRGATIGKNHEPIQQHHGNINIFWV